MIGLFMKQIKKINQCFKVKDPSKEEHEAIKSLKRGDASEYQQQLALAYIVNTVARSQDLLYIPGSLDETAFISGRAFVGQHILKLLNVPIGTYTIEERAEENDVR